MEGEVMGNIFSPPIPRPPRAQMLDLVHAF